MSFHTSLPAQLGTANHTLGEGEDPGTAVSTHCRDAPWGTPRGVSWRGMDDPPAKPGIEEKAPAQRRSGRQDRARLGDAPRGSPRASLQWAGDGRAMPGGPLGGPLSLRCSAYLGDLCVRVWHLCPGGDSRDHPYTDKASLTDLKRCTVRMDNVQLSERAPTVGHLIVIHRRLYIREALEHGYVVKDPLISFGMGIDGFHEEPPTGVLLANLTPCHLTRLPPSPPGAGRSSQTHGAGEG